MSLRRIVLVRHGETDGQSSVRFHGSTDVDLSSEGEAQMRLVAGRVGQPPCELVVASPLKRSWRSAVILSAGRSVRLEDDFREIDFGRWEGLTKEEIQTVDPVLYRDWQSYAESFDFPGGEAREVFRARVGRGLDRLLASQVRSVLAALHKGVIREIARRLTGEALPPGEPALGEPVVLVRRADGSWREGVVSSDPAVLAERRAAARSLI